MSYTEMVCKYPQGLYRSAASIETGDVLPICYWPDGSLFMVGDGLAGTDVRLVELAPSDVSLAKSSRV